MVAVAAGNVTNAGASNWQVSFKSEVLPNFVGMPSSQQLRRRKTLNKGSTVGSRTRTSALDHPVYGPAMRSLRRGPGIRVDSAAEAFVPMRFVPAMIEVLQTLLKTRDSVHDDQFVDC